MARPTIEKMRLKGRHFDPAHLPKFEKKRKARDEDSLRGARIPKAYEDLQSIGGDHTVKRAKRLRRKLVGETTPTTMASSRYMRKVRRSFAGNVYRLLSKAGMSNARAFTLIPRNWAFTPEQLWRQDPRRLMKTFLADVYRPAKKGNNAKSARGCIIAHLHGDFDPRTGLYQLHIHGTATHEQTKVIRQLRKRRKYNSSLKARQRDSVDVRHRVKVGKIPLTDDAAWPTYALKSYWPAHPSFELPGETVKHGRRHGRMSEPFHTLYLLWLDQWRPQDITILIHVESRKGGLHMKR
jgi:hypothetical protein